MSPDEIRIITLACATRITDLQVILQSAQEELECGHYARAAAFLEKVVTLTPTAIAGARKLEQAGTTLPLS